MAKKLVRSIGCLGILFALLLLTFSPCRAEEGIIKGHVYTNNTPLKESEVILISASPESSFEEQMVTGKDGSFEFKELNFGEYYIKAGKRPTYPFIWYEEAQEKFKAIKLNLNSQNKIIENVDFELRPKFLFTYSQHKKIKTKR